MNNKTQILSGINAWMEAKVDELAAGNVWMAIAANTIKRVASDVIEAYLPMDVLEMALANHGVVDANILADEFIASLDNVDNVSTELAGGIVVSLTPGTIRLELPSNGAVKALLGGDNVINFRAEDIKELAQFINNAKN